MTAPANLVAALPQYSIGGKIGSGGMGVVFEGVHRELGRHVAIKQLPGELVHKPGMDVRFDREAKVLASLDHPHIVPVYDYVHSGGDRLLVMEKLDGATVFERYQRTGFTGEQSCAIALATLAGLHAAHAAGVLHLDVKPKNLLFTSQGVLKVADFGIAQVISEGATLVTHGGEVLGTPAYISPEQASGNPLTPAADVYSAGTVLYELLSGRLPFDSSRGALSMMRQHIFGDPQPITGVPEPLAQVVMRSLTRETDQRYRDAEAFAADLSAAAHTVYGPGWLERSGIPVHLSPRVMGGQATTSPRVRGPEPEPALVTTRTAPRRRPAVVPALIGAAALITVVVLAFLTPATLDHPKVLDLRANGIDLTKPVEADLSQPIVVQGMADQPFILGMSLYAGDVKLATSPDQRVTPGPGGQFDVQADLPAVTRWIVGGAVTGELHMDSTVQRFTLVAKQSPIASAMGAGSLVLGLFAMAYLESTLRIIRRGHRRRTAVVAAVPLGALFGAAVWLLVSVLTKHEPSQWYGVGCAVAGAVAAVGAVIATRRAAV